MLGLVSLFVLLPALELYLLIELGTRVGALNTFGIIVVTGFVGAGLVKQQGLGVFQRIQSESAAGRLPATELLEGLVLLIAGALLVTPGLLTDVAGFLALVPPLRRRAAQAVADRVVTSGQSSFFHIRVGQMGGAEPFDPQRGPFRPPSGREGTVVDVDSRPVPPKPLPPKD